MSDLTDEIDGMKSGGAFAKYIEYIRFPRYRNLEKDTRIDFTFPLTVFVGKNGSNKSSTLQALYGTPGGNSLGDFWFSTELDPIKEVEDGDRHCLIYGHRNCNCEFCNDTGDLIEAHKTRIQRKGKPEYWEPSRPLKKYSMKMLPDGKRHEQIDMNMIYIDFRSILSAFDKYFYFKKPKKLKARTKQDYLIKKSKNLSNVIKTEKIQKAGTAEQNRAPVSLTESELTAISRILGKKYLAGTVVEHKFFDEWGTSVLYETENIKYSEAYAGSGEIAVVELVHKIHLAPSESLILLDEPDVSIHPGAQAELKIFLLNAIKTKKLQIVMSTHSPTLIDGLPPSSTKVFTELPDGKIRVLSDKLPEEAFFFVGHLHSSKKTICVEDLLAEEIVKEVLDKIGPDTAALFDVKSYPGGCDQMKQAIAVHSRDFPSNIYYVFDGDQNLKEKIEPQDLAERDKTKDRLNELIEEVTGSNIKFGQDSGDEAQAIKVRLDYLEFFSQNVFFFPLSNPEEIVWDEEVANAQLKSIGKSDEETLKVMELIGKEQDHKQKFHILAQEVNLSDSSKDILCLQKIFVRKWINANGQGYQECEGILTEIKNRS